jgi:hypothetical protein
MRLNVLQKNRQFKGWDSNASMNITIIQLDDLGNQYSDAYRKKICSNDWMIGHKRIP